MDAQTNAASGAPLDEPMNRMLDALDIFDHIKIAKLDCGTPILDKNGLDITNQERMRLNKALGLDGIEIKTADGMRNRAFRQWIGGTPKLADISRPVIGVAKGRRHPADEDDLYVEPVRPTPPPKADPVEPRITARPTETVAEPPAQAAPVLNDPVVQDEPAVVVGPEPVVEQIAELEESAETERSPTVVSDDEQLKRTAREIRRNRHKVELDILVAVANGLDNIEIGALLKMSVPAVANSISKMYPLFQVPKKDAGKRYGPEERKHLGAATRLAYPEKFEVSPPAELEQAAAPTAVAEAEPVVSQDITSDATPEPNETIEPVVETVEDVSEIEAESVDDVADPAPVEHAPLPETVEEPSTAVVETASTGSRDALLARVVQNIRAVVIPRDNLDTQLLYAYGRGHTYARMESRLPVTESDARKHVKRLFAECEVPERPERGYGKWEQELFREACQLAFKKDAVQPTTPAPEPPVLAEAVVNEPVSVAEPKVAVEPEPVIEQIADPKPAVVEKAPVPVAPQKIEKGEDEAGPHAVDLHVGQQIRRRRKILGVSQERLADELGLTFQQVQKYERGKNRVSASKLYEIGRFLQTSIQYFFDGLPGYDTISAAEVVARTNGFVSKRIARARRHLRTGLAMLDEIPIEDEDSDEAS